MTSTQFDNLYRKNYAILYRIAYTLIRDEEECRDIINETFAELLESNHTENISNIDGYLYNSVKNRALSFIRKQSMAERLKRFYPIERELSSQYDHEYERKLLQVHQFLDRQLSPPAREAIKLVFEKGMTYKDAADMMNVSYSTINKHVVNTLRLLRDKFKSEN